MNNKTELSKGLFGETDRSRGEYHFKSGNTERLYSDAHYSAYGEDPIPPRYYIPPESSKQSSKKNPKKNLGLVAVLLLCLSCAIIGGIAGAAFVTRYFDSRVSSLSATGVTSADVVESVDRQFVAISDDLADNIIEDKHDEKLSSSQLYDLACNQVVSITTEYTYSYNGRPTPGVVTGSGFVVGEDGYIITNLHVVDKAYYGGYMVNVDTNDGTSYDGKIVFIDDVNDLALIKVDAENLNVVDFGDDEDIIGGAEITIAGNPYGMFNVSSGRISNPSVGVDIADNGEEITMFQLDVTVYEGNSGGPVYDDEGEVIGIVTAKVDVDSSDGIGFAIPASKAESLFESFLTNGETNPATLSVDFFEGYEGMFQIYYSYPEGAFIERVYPGGCSEKAGLMIGDVIMQIDDYPITSYLDVNDALKHFSPNDQVSIVLYRDARVYETELNLDPVKTNEYVLNTEKMG